MHCLIHRNKLKKNNPELYWKLKVESMQRQKDAAAKLNSAGGISIATAGTSSASSALVNGHKSDAVSVKNSQTNTSESDVILVEDSPMKVSNTPSAAATPAENGPSQVKYCFCKIYFKDMRHIFVFNR